MAQLLTLNFNFPLNESLQVGDFVFYVPTTPVGTVNTFDVGQLPNVVRLGQVNQILPFNQTTQTYDIVVWYDNVNVQQPGANDYIMFAKDKVINTTSLIGYYAEVKFVNDSKEEAELFSIGSEINESSK
tara:strand:- start:1907 stop:2293 length:387 start_codon:yes stop_codon:yes gene_type:complete